MKDDDEVLPNGGAFGGPGQKMESGPSSVVVLV